MSSSRIDTKVLSESFQELMDGWRLRAAVFVTFRFDPGFFEQEVLPVFFDIPLSHAPVARVLHLADVLRETGPVAVYYDPRGLEPGAGSARTDFQRITINHPTGYFHPKNALLLVESTAPEKDWPGRQPPRRLIVAAMSANLTRAGWWENVEVAHIETIDEGMFCGFRDDLLLLVALLRRASSPDTVHSALDEIHSFIKKNEQAPQRLSAGLLISRVFTGDKDLLDFLEENAGNRIRNRYLEVISPYFDKSESLRPIRDLLSRFRPRETRVFLPRGIEGEALCSQDFWNAMRGAGVSWGALPKELVRLSRDSQRFVHAKVYRFFDPDDRRQTFFVGSVNLTNAGFRRGGNVESGFLVELEGTRKSDWLLEIDERNPSSFAIENTTKTPVVGPGTNLSLRFDWTTSTTRAVWTASTSSPALRLLGAGVILGEIEPLEPHICSELPATTSLHLKQHLLSSSFVTVAIESEPDAVILVDEDGFLDKPPLLATLSPDEILRYWSLLTDAQKQEFLELHVPDSIDQESAFWIGGLSRDSHEQGVFGTFAHVFLSFGNVERRIRQALSDGRHKEAVDRLFGQKFDSVRHLVQKVSEQEKPNPVRDYITLLCAIQLLEAIKKSEPEFYTAERSRFELTKQARTALEPIKAAFSFAVEDERKQFFEWFEPWFLRRATPIAQEPSV